MRQYDTQCFLQFALLATTSATFSWGSILCAIVDLQNTNDSCNNCNQQIIILMWQHKFRTSELFKHLFTCKWRCRLCLHLILCTCTSPTLAKQILFFYQLMSVCVCLRKKIPIRNCYNLVGICMMVPHTSDKISVTFDLDLRFSELLSSFSIFSSGIRNSSAQVCAVPGDMV